MPRADLDRRIAAVRHFNRFYTQRVGVLSAPRPFSLTEARVLYELIHRVQPTASELVKSLGLDAGYLSRILRDFGKRGLVNKQASCADGRQSLLSITERGRKIFAPIEARTQEEIAALLNKLGPGAQIRLVGAMQAIERVLDAEAGAKVPYILRPPAPGDWGWIVSRHAAIYNEAYGWNEQFEALVAEIVGQSIRRFDSKRERCWIAERNGENAGSVMLVKDSEHVARLRLLLVEPGARGLGIGTRLVAECERFAREARYRRITLWTHGNLLAARRVYEKAGYRLTRAEKSTNFGHKLISETWDLKL
ncbi:MAG TPA: helix-turn-helix domain-containing GNAT family N-acetyltransferase [Xanthobacteraceae bacterium]|nr:helix-turn-helix domain-containing GNAT family N-acetyltransferase [Xanthobacteraceae bacterium]